MPTDALNIWAVAVFAIGGVLYLVIGVSRVAITRLERGDVDARFATSASWPRRSTLSPPTSWRRFISGRN
jgi:hypothetical protein